MKHKTNAFKRSIVTKTSHFLWPPKIAHCALRVGKSKTKSLFKKVKSNSTEMQFIVMRQAHWKKIRLLVVIISSGAREVLNKKWQHKGLKKGKKIGNFVFWQKIRYNTCL